MKFDETICAPATIPGTGAVSIIRVSGPDALLVADRTISFITGAAMSSEGYTVKYGRVVDSGHVLDEVLCNIYRAPHSYTGEDSVEIFCHASAYIAERLLQMLCAHGARPALPGEFTQRAFINGKMDLAQAEAVADVIAAGSEASLRIAMNQMRGGYSAKLSSLRDELLQITALMELELDFSEEEVEFADRGKLKGLVDEAIGHISELAATFKAGNAIKNGIPVAIAGPVNTGKSTLLNALLGEDRAIVSDIAGTTRDTVEETMVLEGVTYRFIDTAGIRETGDEIEKIGVGRSFSAIEGAEVIIALIDATAPLEEAAKELLEVVSRVREGQKLIVARNKVDLFDAIAPEQFPTKDMSYGTLELKYPAFGTWQLDPRALTAALCRELSQRHGADAQALQQRFEGGVVLDISARTGEGLEELRHLVTKGTAAGLALQDTLVTNLRHYQALRDCLSSLERVRTALATLAPGDLISQDLREALHHLGSITGAVTTDEILGEIFGRFCIGK